MPEVIAIEQIGAGSKGMQLPLDDVGNRGLPRSREARKPDNRRAVTMQLQAGGFVDEELLGVNVARSA